MGCLLLQQVNGIRRGCRKTKPGTKSGTARARTCGPNYRLRGCRNRKELAGAGVRWRYQDKRGRLFTVILLPHIPFARGYLWPQDWAGDGCLSGNGPQPETRLCTTFATVGLEKMPRLTALAIP
ncbi:Uncharacterised protein [Halioglobus japonicus]|nr:Uncharacterised protein [Halioglobus japonicus]